jgi:hypothetical protein
MPDTGAPWNIPYVDPTDLVRDYPQASEDLADAIADGLDAAENAGIGSNVVQAVKTDTFTTSSTTYVDVTGVSVTITPSSDTAKILLIVNSHMTNSNENQAVHARLARGGTAIAVGDADGSRVQSTFSITNLGTSNQQSTGAHFLDAPNSAVAVTYTLQVRVAVGTAVINRSASNDNNTSQGLGITTLTAIEVAA